MMINIFKSLGGYAFVTIIQGALSFVSVPVLINALPSGDFVYWSLFEPIIFLSANFLLFGLNYGIIKKLASLEVDGALAIGVYVQKHIPWSIIILSSIALPIYATNNNILRTIGMLCVIFFESCLAFFLAYSRGINNKKYFMLAALPKLLFVAAILFAINIRGLKIELNYYIFYYMLSYLVPILYIALMASKNFTVNDQTKTIHRDSIIYGLPIFASSVSSLIISNADRYMVNNFLSERDVLNYVVAAKISGLVSFAAAPINMWWPSVRFKKFSSKKERADVLVRRVNQVLLYYCFVFVAGAIVVPLIYNWYSGGGVIFDKSIVIILLLSGCLAAFGPIISIGSMNEGKTIYIFYTSCVAGVFGLFFAWAGVILFGGIGAAAGNFLGQLFALMLSIFISQKNDYINFDWKKIIFIVSISILVAFNLS